MFWSDLRPVTPNLAKMSFEALEETPGAANTYSFVQQTRCGALRIKSD